MSPAIVYVIGFFVLMVAEFIPPTKNPATTQDIIGLGAIIMLIHCWAEITKEKK